MYDPKSLAKKANSGDREALTILILDVPSHAMKGMEPEEFSKKVEEDDVFAEYVSNTDRPSKEMYHPDDEYKDGSEDEGDAEDGSVAMEEVKSLLDSWTERDPETAAGSYYNDLMMVYEKHTGSSEE